MKSKKNAILCLIIAVLLICTVVMTACDTQGGDDKEYVIQYTDDAGLHEITVKHNQLFSIEDIPQRTGYTFEGLFDSEAGGTQYVSSKGTSLNAFTDKKNMVLYPQFKAKEYTVILDYQGAQVTGGRQLTVSYDSSLPELPKNVTLEHKNFVGWYTKPNCEGVQIADQYGLIPLVSVVNAKNFDTSKETITLYAGFEAEKINVTCCFENGETEVVQVDYDTPVSKIVPQKRVDGKAPLTWSKSKDGEIFNGTISSETVLYAVEYAPVIELDSNGGSKVIPIVAREGSTIVLPTPTKDMAQFAYWEDMQGNRYDSTEMPSSSISLKAVWQAKIVFDENGGTEVNDISERAGTAITLPTPQRSGFSFAGWYTEDGSIYLTDTMPSEGVMLFAKYYSIIGSESEVFYTDAGSFRWETTPMEIWLGEEFLKKNNLNVTITIEFDAKDLGQGIFEGSDKWWIELWDSKNDDHEVLAETTLIPSTNFRHYSIQFDINSSKVGEKHFYLHLNRGNNFGNGYYKNVVIKKNAVDTGKLY